MGGGRRLGQAVEHAPLVEQRRVGRVQVLGLALAKDAPAEGDGAPAPVRDREHDAAAEVFEGIAPVVGALHQAGGDDLVLVGAGPRQGALEGAARVGGEAEAEAGDDRVVEAAAKQYSSAALPSGKRSERA